jgi:serine/threonine protein kinase
MTDFEHCLDSALLFKGIRCSGEPLIYDDNSGKMFMVKRLKDDTKFETLMLRVQDIEKPEDRTAVKRELDILRSLNHPNLQNLVDHKTDSYSAHFLLEWPALGDLQHVMRSKRQRKLEGNNQIFSVFYKIVKAVHYLQFGLNIVHGNLTDSNILMKSADEPMIANLRSSVPRDSMDSYRGVPGWMDPVFYSAEEGVHKFLFNESIDVYSLGVILYQMFHESQLPFGKDWEYRKKVADGNYFVRSGVPYEAVFAINRCLQVDPENRLTLSQLLRVAQAGLGRKTYRTTTEELVESNRRTSSVKVLQYIEKSVDFGPEKVSVYGVRFV